MNNFKEIADKCLKGELFGTFIAERGSRFHSSFLSMTGDKDVPYRLHGFTYYPNGHYLSSESSDMDIINFIPDKNMERTVKLTLEKAKEWYKKGGELREVALQAYKEDELKEVRPKSWEEYVHQMEGKIGYYVNQDSGIRYFDHGTTTNPEYDRNLLPTKELAEAFRAYMQLISLRQAWIGDWKPDWENDSQTKYCIGHEYGDIHIWKYGHTNRSLSFPTQEMAEDFVSCFRDLLEKAKPLI
jgi:hypothetical protein